MKKETGKTNFVHIGKAIARISAMLAAASVLALGTAPSAYAAQTKEAVWFKGKWQANGGGRSREAAKQNARDQARARCGQQAWSGDFVLLMEWFPDKNSNSTWFSADLRFLCSKKHKEKTKTSWQRAGDR